MLNLCKLQSYHEHDSPILIPHHHLTKSSNVVDTPTYLVDDTQMASKAPPQNHHTQNLSLDASAPISIIEVLNTPIEPTVQTELIVLMNSVITEISMLSFKLSSTMIMKQLPRVIMMILKSRNSSMS
jgi:hypothetical protein